MFWLKYTGPRTEPRGIPQINCETNSINDSYFLASKELLNHELLSNPGFLIKQSSFKTKKGADTNSALDAVHSQTPVIKSVVAHHRLIVRHEEGPFDLSTPTDMHECSVLPRRQCCVCLPFFCFFVCLFLCHLVTKKEPRDSGDEFRHEDQSQKHGVLQRRKGWMFSHLIKRTCWWTHGNAPVSTSRVDLCRWRNTQRVQTARWPLRYQWGHMGRWRGCWKSTACRGPT